VTVTENLAVGTTVVRVAARDRDVGDNAAVTYFLGASSQSVYGDVFSVDAITGDLVVVGEVDRERAAVYHVMVGARDAGPEPLVDETTVIVKVDCHVRLRTDIIGLFFIAYQNLTGRGC